jgi:hypothetical protein
VMIEGMRKKKHGQICTVYTVYKFIMSSPMILDISLKLNSYGSEYRC